MLAPRGEWEVPHGALDVAIPRTPTRILLQTVLTIGYAVNTYIYLNDVSPRTRRKSLLQLAVQVVFFVNLPEFLPVQLISALMGLLIERLRPGRTSPFRRFAEVTSLSRFKSRSHVRAVASSSMYRAGLLAPMVQGCLLGLDAYIERFKISYHVASDVGNIGFDHRNGWLSAVGLMAGILGLSYRVGVWFFERGSHGDETELASMGSLYDGAGSKEDDGPDSYRSGDLGWLRPGLETRTVLVEGFFAAAIHQVPLAATHRKSQLFDLTVPFLIMVLVLVMISAKQARPSIAGKAQLLLGAVTLAFTSWTISESLAVDFDELYAVNAGIVLPYNYRWQVTDRIDRFLRLIV